MELKKFEKIVKRAFNSLEPEPDVKTVKKEMRLITHYSYAFRPRTEKGREFCSKYYSQSSHSNPYRLVYHLVDNLVEFLKEQNTTHE